MDCDRYSVFQQFVNCVWWRKSDQIQQFTLTLTVILKDLYFSPPPVVIHASVTYRLISYKHTECAVQMYTVDNSHILTIT